MVEENISSMPSSNSDENASELLGNIEEVFSSLLMIVSGSWLSNLSSKSPSLNN